MTASSPDQALPLKQAANTKTGLGTFFGVFVPSILMLFGVIIFLRLGWITGRAGLSTTLIIITFAALIGLTTILSLTAIATNLEMGKGGLYYLISRSLGPEVGCAVGLPLYFRQTLSVAFSVVGFAESLHDLLPMFSISTYGIISLILLAIAAYTSLKGALKIQVVIFVILVFSLISLFMGNTLAPDTSPPSITAPLIPLGFWSLFAIFFPAMTGIESSVSLSGDLKNPSRSLPIGTISAFVVAYIIYMAIPCFLVKYIPLERLANDTMILKDFARIPSLIILGIWGATLSSGLGSLLGAPRTLQALAEDGVVPKIFGKVTGKDQSPQIATIITFLIAFATVYLGSVNIIAPMLTMFCLICYGVLNLSVGLEALMANPSWRPRFRIHWFVSIVSAFLCLLTMLMINAGVAILSLILVFLIYLIAKRRALHSSWDDLRIGILMLFSRIAIYRLAYSRKISKSWRPHFLVFIKNPANSHNHLVRLSNAISQGKGFLTMASFAQLKDKTEEEKQKLEKNISQNLHAEQIQALVHINDAEMMLSTIHHMIQHHGLGPLVPNTIVLGEICKEFDPIELAKIVLSAYHKHRNVIVFNENNLSQFSHSFGNKISGNIQLWWDDTAQANNDFMLILAHMLQSNPSWKRVRLTLKGIASCDSQRQQRLQELQALSIEKRLPWNSEIFLSSDEDFFDLVPITAREATLLLLSLRAPFENETLEEYALHLQKLLQISEKLPPTALVLSSDYTPLEKILK
jgi:amino acid transporter